MQKLPAYLTKTEKKDAIKTTKESMEGISEFRENWVRALWRTIVFS